MVARIREYNEIGISLFFLAGYPHLEESYRIGEYILPHFRDQAGVNVQLETTQPLAAANG
ncbi:hypothetical protein [Methylobacillus glycogenes]|uniref:hypothetical protein n=1 Tax=Methylobacillus glycogenes TaxID=406 RepID=UPI000B0330F3|nr:hypothetical protein [Methylobacillus glycogenes]